MVLTGHDVSVNKIKNLGKNIWKKLEFKLTTNRRCEIIINYFLNNIKSLLLEVDQNKPIKQAMCISVKKLNKNKSGE